MRTATLLAGLFASLFVMVGSAHAQMQCGPRKLITDQLKTKFQESSGGLGLSGGVLFEIWSSPKTGTFTILSTTPQHISCIMAAGRDWSFREQKIRAKQYEY
ncbi:MAG: hypothetical protein AAGD43_22640 [Pseudomonadota bacterium]